MRAFTSNFKSSDIVGGGSTITKEVAAGSLAIGRARQVAFADWSRPQKKPQ